MSNLASTSRAQLRYRAETAFGVTPVSGNSKQLRMTGETLDFNLSKEKSKEIRSDRQNTSATTVDAQASGDVNIEMSYGEYDELLQALLMGTWAAYGTNGEGTTFSAAYAADSITAAVAPSGANAFTTLKKGQFFRVRHASNANNGKVFRVSKTVAPTATVITLDPGTPAVVVADSAGAYVQAARVMNGVTERSFSIEKELSDVAQFFIYRGQYVSKMALKFASAALLDGSFSFMGKDSARDDATMMPGTPADSLTYDIMNAVKGVGQLWEGGAPMAGVHIKSMDLNVDNNLRMQTAIGTLGAVGIGVGDFSASGSMQMYFANGAMYDKFIADEYSELVVSCQDAAGNGYIMTMPKMMVMTHKITSPSKNQDVMADITFECFNDAANADATLRKTFILDRVGTALALP